MHLDPDICYEAVLSKNRRFDGWFFVGVASTGVYCRPVCPVRPPRRPNCHFFPTPASAEKAGFRPCMRCRPELAPGSGLLDASGNLAAAAATLIEDGFLNDRTLEELTRRIGITERHLRRIFTAQFGVSIVEFAQTSRLLMAKRLLTDTRLPVSTVASAAGFGSVRRLNDLFVRRYGFSPLRLRKGAIPAEGGNMTFTLTYRPPFAWPDILRFLARQQIHGIEYAGENEYARIVEIPRSEKRVAGWLSVRHVPQRCALAVTLSPSLTPVVPKALARVRRLFDLDCRPDVVDAHLEEFSRGLPGMRVPGAFDGMELAVRAIVRQQTTSAPTLSPILARMGARFGTAVAAAPFGLAHAFPPAGVLCHLHPAALQETGMTRAEAEAIVRLARAVAEGNVVLEPMAPLEETLAALRAIPGIGEWAVQYIAMRAMGWPNAFPAEDAMLMKQLGHTSPAEMLSHASRWEPWRAYAAFHIWRQHGDLLP